MKHSKIIIPASHKKTFKTFHIAIHRKDDRLLFTLKRVKCAILVLTTSHKSVAQHAILSGENIYVDVIKKRRQLQ